MLKFPLAPFALATCLIAGTAFAQTTEAEAPAAPDLSGLSADTVVANVGGTPITLGEVIAVRISLPEQYQQLPDEVLFKALVDQLSDQTMLENAARAGGLDQSNAFKLAIRNQTRALLADSFMTEAMLGEMTEAAVEAAYKEQYLDIEAEEQVRAAHILVETEAEATDIKAKIDGGADFAAMAAEHGSDGTASRGGDLGWFVHGQMVPEFADAAFAMETGTVSAPVQSPFGWHLIQLNDRRPVPVPPLAEVREDVINGLSQKVQTEILEGLRADAEITPAEVEIPPAAIRADNLIVE